jgi:hypothetical protein
MNDSVITSSSPAVPPEVHKFAAEKGVSRYVNAAIELARQAFPSSALYLTVGQDAEDEMHNYIAFDIEATGQTSEELLEGQQIWSAGLSRVCPSRHAVYFVLGWR